MNSLLKSIRRALADYSLRKFILYASNPFHWGDLFELRRRAQSEVRDFSRQVSKWREMETPSLASRTYIFHPWLKETRVLQAANLQANEIPPIQESPDPELTMRLDRLGWVLQMAICHTEGAWEAAGKWLAKRWKTNIACRDSYSVSERLSNLILMWNLQMPAEPLGTDLLSLMDRDADYLLNHLEYHGESKTNNHILNNARALILYGAFANNERFYGAGCWLLEDQLKKHVYPDGVVREASTHYQWVITRWVMEIGCAFHARDRLRYLELQSLLEKMLDVCEAMKLGEPGKNYLPLIGDISPDFPPMLYEGMTGLGYAIVGCGDQYQADTSTSGGLWSRFFVGRAKGRTSAKWASSDKSWARLTKGNWSLLTHADMHPDDHRATHGHHDLFSFELAFDGLPLVIDPGRKDYLAPRDSQQAGVLDEWHNTITVDNRRTGFIPRGYMPKAWLAKCRTGPEVEVDDQRVAISLVVPREVPGISRIQRTISCADPNLLTIVNQVAKATPKPIQIKLIIYLMGDVYPLDGWVRIEIANRKLGLRWSGLNQPTMRAASRYVSYGVAEPCTRLEWHAKMNTDIWESTIMISPRENDV